MSNEEELLAYIKGLDERVRKLEQNLTAFQANQENLSIQLDRWNTNFGRFLFISASAVILAIWEFIIRGGLIGR